ncbi:MAG: aminotransferase class III-fold pyridoxal phosphate-dependent enzyme [Spirochaeta sp.]|nr:aminotransferase class III-fold pyridoxal phosphate-dependent enzyme [Spirochaeta sp.]
MAAGHPFPRCYPEELLVVEKGEGVYLEDQAGNRYLDFAGGIAVNALGYGRDDLAEIAARQMKKLSHISNLFTTGPALELGRKMVKRGGFQAVQFLNSGSEANETALKYARLYAQRTRGKDSYNLLCFHNAFHGRTLGALSVTPTAKYQEPFMPLIPGTKAIDFNDCRALESTLNSSFAAVITETIQGEGGLKAMTPDFAATLNRLCRELDVLLIVDEVQTGLSRTGTFFAFEGVGLEPDLVTLAKPLAGGLPLSAVLIPEKINSLIHLGEHGTTFGGGPVTTAVASKIWDLLSEEDFITSVAEKGGYFKGLLGKLSSRFAFLGEVRGRGLLLGLEVVKSSENGQELLPVLLEELRNKGLLVLRSGKSFLRFAPPLVISREEIARGVDIMEEVFKSIAVKGGLSQ